MWRGEKKETPELNKKGDLVLRKQRRKTKLGELKKVESRVGLSHLKKVGRTYRREKR